MPRNDKPGLADKMRKLAMISSRAVSLIALANELDEATVTIYSEPHKLTAEKMLEFDIAYLEARKVYCEETGEPLVP